MSQVFLNEEQRQRVAAELPVIYNEENETIKSSGCASLYDYLVGDKARWPYRFLAAAGITGEDFRSFSSEKKRDITREIRDVIVENNVYIY